MAGTSGEGEQAAAFDVQQLLAEGRTRLAQVQTTVGEYATKYADAAKDGKLFEGISEDLDGAKTSLEEARTGLEEGDTTNVTQGAVLALNAASRALATLTVLAKQAQAYDEEHTVTEKLYTAIDKQIQEARGQLNAVQQRAVVIGVQGQALLTTARTGATTAIEKARGAVGELYTTASTLPGVKSATDLLSLAGKELEQSYEVVSKAPVTEIPYVALLETVALARKGLTTLSDKLEAEGSPVAAVSAGVRTTVTSAQGKASAAVTSAHEAVVHLQQTAKDSVDALLERASATASSLEARAINAAIALDLKFDVTRRVADLDAQYRVSEQLGAGYKKGVELAQAVEARLSLTARAEQALDKAKGLDESVTGGRGTALVESAVAAASGAVEGAVEYATNVAKRFQEGKEKEGENVTA